ncbi:MAG: flagellar biosynthetic protein FliQ [Vampirovibrionales bacterium]
MAVAMTETLFVHLIQETLWFLLLVSAPILVLTTTVGTVVSLLQAVTQIQEQALAFIPKLLVALGLLWLTLPWMMGLLHQHCLKLFDLMRQLG